MSKEFISNSGIKEAAAFLIPRINIKPRIGLISGTGLESLYDLLKDYKSFPVKTIPGFPLLDQTERNLLFGSIEGLQSVILSKRLHLYEGYSMNQIAFIIRLFKELGIKTLIVTNAAGGLNPLYSPGQIMIIIDHINLMGGSPLSGPNPDEYGPRFPDMSAPYDPDLIRLMENTAEKKGIHILKGIYVAVPGPNLETRAETRFLRSIGADAVGMSTVPEVIAAVHCGIRVLGLSVLSNINLPDSPKVHTLDEILEVVNRASPEVKRLIKGLMNAISKDVTGGSNHKSGD
ncbi:MAG: purine-nucleoside phosphorylase [bacterium]